MYPSAGNSRSSFDLGDIESGDYKDFTFGIVTAKTATALDIRIDLKESRPQFSKLAQPLNLALNKIEQTTQQLVVKGRESGGRIAQAPNLSSDVDRDIPVLAKPDRNRWGVIIGIENYQKVNAPVPFARRDALIMKDYFINILGIPEENIYTKTNNDASKTEFSTIFGPRLAKNASGKDNEVFVYYSGHGVPDNRGREAYLLPYDGIPEYPETSGYGLQTLYTDLGKLNAKHVTIFLDSCFSGRNRDNQSILTGAKALVITPELPSVAPGMTVFSAAGGQQMANVYEDQQHGLFTYYLMKGLRGEADADNDKNITQQELNNYLRQNVTSISRRLDREQEPQHEFRSQTGDSEAEMKTSRVILIVSLILSALMAGSCAGNRGKANIATQGDASRSRAAAEAAFEGRSGNLAEAGRAEDKDPQPVTAGRGKEQRRPDLKEDLQPGCTVKVRIDTTLVFAEDTSPSEARAKALRILREEALNRALPVDVHISSMVSDMYVERNARFDENTASSVFVISSAGAASRAKGCWITAFSTIEITALLCIG